MNGNSAQSEVPYRSHRMGIRNLQIGPECEFSKISVLPLASGFDFSQLVTHFRFSFSFLLLKGVYVCVVVRALFFSNILM